VGIFHKDASASIDPDPTTFILDFSPSLCYNLAMSKKYRVRWCETVEYYTDVWASDEDQALDTFHDLPMDKIPIGPTGWKTMEMDTIQVEEQ
jgi:hypothetical protein